MLRKTLIALAATVALGIGASTVDAKMGGSGSGSGSGSGKSTSMSGSGGMPGGNVKSFSTPSTPSGLVGPTSPGTMGPKTTSSNWGHHHHHRHDRFFFGAGFAGPYYDYGYDSCWRIVPTYYGGWRRVWVCDYPYWGY